MSRPRGARSRAFPRSLFRAARRGITGNALKCEIEPASGWRANLNLLDRDLYRGSDDSVGIPLLTGRSRIFSGLCQVLSPHRDCWRWLGGERLRPGIRFRTGGDTAWPKRSRGTRQKDRKGLLQHGLEPDIGPRSRTSVQGPMRTARAINEESSIPVK